MSSKYELLEALDKIAELEQANKAMYEALKAALTLIEDTTSGGAKTKKMICRALAKAEGR